jgi:hypothetical protein
MTHWRHILHCLFMLVLAAGSADAEMDMPSIGDPLALVVGSSERGFAYNAGEFPINLNLHRLYDPERVGSISNDAVKSKTHVNLELEGTLINNEDLGRISGGASLFEPPDAASQRTLAIILWDEGKSRRCASYEQGNNIINGTISVQGR